MDAWPAPPDTGQAELALPAGQEGTPSGGYIGTGQDRFGLTALLLCASPGNGTTGMVSILYAWVCGTGTGPPEIPDRMPTQMLRSTLTLPAQLHDVHPDRSRSPADSEESLDI